MFPRKSGVVINSYHGVKGEEYTTVIAFGFLNGLIPNWDLIINKKDSRTIETQKLLYVVCSRSKKICIYSRNRVELREEERC